MSRIAILALLAPLAGCVDLDPYTRPGVWHPLGVNAVNIRAMVADPNELEMGEPAAPPSGDAAAAAVARLRADQVKPLPASAISDVGNIDSPTPAAQAPNNAPSAAAPVAAGSGS